MLGDRRVLGGGDLAQQLQRRLVARLERPGREADDVREQDRDVEPFRDPGPAPRKAPATPAGRPARAREPRSAARARPRRPGGRSAAGPGCPSSTARRRTGRRPEAAAGGTWRSPRAGAWNRRGELARRACRACEGAPGARPPKVARRWDPDRRSQRGIVAHFATPCVISGRVSADGPLAWCRDS